MALRLQNFNAKLALLILLCTIAVVKSPIDFIGVFKTVMHYGYAGISRETIFLSEKIDLYISQETFLCSIPDTIP